MPRRVQSLAALLSAAAAMAVAVPPALAQQAPTLGQPTPQETAPPTSTTASAGDRGLKTWQEALIFGAGGVLLGGIAVAIIGDARERAPRHGHEPATELGGAKRHRARGPWRRGRRGPGARRPAAARARSAAACCGTRRT